MTRRARRLLKTDTWRSSKRIPRTAHGMQVLQHFEISLPRRYGTELALFFTAPAIVVMTELGMGLGRDIEIRRFLGKDCFIGGTKA
jgi:hypothetical protein